MKFNYSNVNSKYGAPMGRRESLGNGISPVKLYCERVKFYDGAYDKGGAYWGAGTNLYVCYGEEFEGDLIVQFIRASSRDAAKAIMLSRRRNVKFYH